MDNNEKLEGVNDALTRIAEEYGMLGDEGIDEVLDDLTHYVADKLGIVKRLTLDKPKRADELVVRAEGPASLFCNTCGVFVPLEDLWITGEHGTLKDKSDISDHRIWEQP